jgi:hypothetical protein
VPPEAGQTAVVVPVSAAEPLVAPWRARFDPSAAQGMPAHVTALHPFVPATDRVVAELRALCAASPVLDVRFARTARFPGVLHLAPEPADGLRRLTLAIAERWPEAPPYGGAFEEVIPHLTVALGDHPGEVEAELRRGLPFAARLAEACLYEFDGSRWIARERLPFRAASRRPGPSSP